MFKVTWIFILLLYSVFYMKFPQEDEPGINPVLKVWNLDKLDKQGHPMCVRISRVIPHNKPTPATALSVYDNLNLMAVGFSDGSILLYRGDAYTR
jgi:hypothetical protein